MASSRAEPRPAGPKTPGLPRSDPAGELKAVAQAVRLALAEDLGPHRMDLTTRAVVPEHLQAEAAIVARRAGVLAGLEPARLTFQEVDRRLRFEALAEDGAAVSVGSVVALIEGPLAPILTAERTALNFLQRLSGIATLTRSYVEALTGLPVTVLDTRKTTPGLRALERAAVRAGGAGNHRFGLFDAVLIKDNHVAAAGGVAEAVRRARRTGLPVEVEVETLAELQQALAAGAELILLDNMDAALMREAVALARGRALLEASGGMTLERALEAARAGVDRISVGALTHSAPALDLSLEVKRTWT